MPRQSHPCRLSWLLVLLTASAAHAAPARSPLGQKILDTTRSMRRIGANYTSIAATLMEKDASLAETFGSGESERRQAQVTLARGLRLEIRADRDQRKNEARRAKKGRIQRARNRLDALLKDVEQRAAANWSAGEGRDTELNEAFQLKTYLLTFKRRKLEAAALDREHTRALAGVVRREADLGLNPARSIRDRRDPNVLRKVGLTPSTRR